MDIPCRVSADLRRREEENDRAEQWYENNQEQMIWEKEDEYQSQFCTQDLIEAVSVASAKDKLELFQAFQAGDAADCLAMLRDIRDSYCKDKATNFVEEM